MSFSYNFSRETYLELLKLLIRAQSRTTRAVFSYIVTAVLFPIVTVYYMISKGGVEKKDILIFVLLGISLVVVAFRLFFLDYRAKMTLEQSERSGQLQPDYFGEHTLSLEGGMLHIRYGGTSMDVPVEEISGFKKEGDFYIFRHGKEIVEAIPNAVRTPEQWQELSAALAAARDAKRRADLLAHLEETLPGAVLNERFTRTPEQMAKTLAALKRRSLLMPATWPKKQLFSLLVPIGLGLYSLAAGYPVYALICLIMFVCFNTSTLMVFLPVYERMLLENHLEPDDEGYRLVARDRVLYLYGRYQVLESPLAGLMAKVDHGEELFLYFSNQSMTFIPGELRSAFLKAVGVLRPVKSKKV